MAPPPQEPPQSPARAARSQVVRGAAHFGWGRTDVSGWGRIAPQGCPGGTASGQATREGGGAQLHNMKKSGKFHNTLRHQRQWQCLTVQSNIPLYTALQQLDQGRAGDIFSRDSGGKIWYKAKSDGRRHLSKPGVCCVLPASWLAIPDLIRWTRLRRRT